MLLKTPRSKDPTEISETDWHRWILQDRSVPQIVKFVRSSFESQSVVFRGQHWILFIYTSSPGGAWRVDTRKIRVLCMRQDVLKRTRRRHVYVTEERGVGRWKAGVSRRVAGKGDGWRGQIRESRKKGRDRNLLKLAAKRDSRVTAEFVELGKKSQPALRRSADENTLLLFCFLPPRWHDTRISFASLTSNSRITFRCMWMSWHRNLSVTFIRQSLVQRTYSLSVSERFLVNRYLRLLFDPHIRPNLVA